MSCIPMPIVNLTQEKILTAAKSLPASPQVMSKLYTMLLDANSGLDAIATLLKRDVAITTRIIRISNSTAYNGRGVSNIEEALQRVGFGEVFRLVGVATNASLADSALRCYGYPAERMSAHNLCSALVSEGIAKRIKYDTRPAYTAGLLRSIGRLLLDRVGREKLTINETYPESLERNQLLWEKKMFGINHFQVAGLLLNEWAFPEVVTEAVRYDRSLETPPPPLAKILNLTECIVRFVGYGLEDDANSWGIPHEELAAVGLSLDDAKAVRDQAIATMLTFQA